MKMPNKLGKVVSDMMVGLIIIVVVLPVILFVVIGGIMFVSDYQYGFTKNEKIEIVAMVHNGENLDEIKKKNQILIGGKAGSEDVLFIDSRYFEKGELYSEDDICDIRSSRYENIEIKKQTGKNWYKVTWVNSP